MRALITSVKHLGSSFTSISAVLAQFSPHYCNLFVSVCIWQAYRIISRYIFIGGPSQDMRCLPTSVRLSSVLLLYVQWSHLEN